MKGKTTFALVSLLFSYLDYQLGRELILAVYGSEVAKLFDSLPVSALYFLLVYTVELSVLLTLGSLVGGLLKKLKSRERVPS